MQIKDQVKAKKGKMVPGAVPCWKRGLRKVSDVLAGWQENAHGSPRKFQPEGRAADKL